MNLIRIRKIPQAKLGLSEPDPSWFGNPSNEVSNPKWTNSNWLKSRFHFSFAEYSNPRNQNFGVLRVLNDDLVQPNRGFGQHPHRNAEICTYVVSGDLTHQDSMGTKETIGRGAIQFMTAGTGITHSEHNKNVQDPLRFIQIWINPRKTSLPPNYGSSPGIYELRHNKWYHMVSDVLTQSESQTPIAINQDINIHVTELDLGQSIEFQLHEKRQAYLLCVEGSARVQCSNESTEIVMHDAAELFGPSTIQFTTISTTTINNSSQYQGGVHLLLIEMAYSGIGRSDL